MKSSRTVRAAGIVAVGVLVIGALAGCGTGAGFPPAVAGSPTTTGPSPAVAGRTATAAPARVVSLSPIARAVAYRSPTPRPRPAATTPPAGTAPVTTSAGRIRPGVTYTGRGTFYSLGGGLGNCLYEGAGTDPAGAYAAMNNADFETARMCGAYVRATGPRGSTVVKIVDKCPECPPGAIDFSAQAFARIADPAAGEVPVSWQLVSPAGIGNIQFRVKEGSSAYWLAIQPRNHRNPVVSLEVQVGGAWRALPRADYNYFVAQSGLGPGPFTIRLTDIYGQQLVTSGITLSPTEVQSTSAQFAQH